MELHNFTLRYKFPDAAEIDDVVERLGENCTDALVGIGVSGVTALAFDRESQTKELAIESAMEHVVEAIPGAVLLGVS